MAVAESDRAIIETYYGRLDPAEVDDVDARIGRLGSAYGAALELLLIERADADRALDEVTSETFRGKLTDKRRRLDARISELVGFLRTTDDVTLPQAAEALLDRATDEGQATTTIAIKSTTLRRGG